MVSVDSACTVRRSIGAAAVFRALAGLGSPSRCVLAAIASVISLAALAQGHPVGAQQPPANAEARTARNGRTSLGLTGHGFVSNDGSFTTVDARAAGAYTAVFGIDDEDTAVGTYVDRRGTLHGFVRRDGRFATIDFPGAKATVVARMNAQGQIVGAYSDTANTPVLEMQHGFLLEDDVFTPIDVPGAVRTQPFGINSHGEIVGAYEDTAGREHGFLRDTAGTFTTIDAPDATSTFAADIDDSRRIVGTFAGAGTPDGGVGGSNHGFLREADGGFTPIDGPNALDTLAFGINNRGQIVGSYYDGQTGLNRYRGFLLEGGTLTPIDVPASSASERPGTIRGTLILDISDNGQRAGLSDFARQAYVQDRQGNFTAIDHPSGSLSGSEEGGVNRRGQIVSSYRDATGTFNGFLLDEQGFTNIAVPGAVRTVAHKINDHGQVVGAYSTVSREGNPQRGFLWDHGVLTSIDVPGAQHTQAFDITNDGQIVGEYQDAAGIFHGFLRDASGSFTTIDVPGAVATSITASNDRGQMVGVYVDTGGALHAFLLDQGAFTTIDVPHATVTIPFGMNSQGQVVGLYVTPQVTRGSGFVFENGTFTDITPPPGTFSARFAVDIDDRGQILGFFE